MTFWVFLYYALEVSSSKKYRGSMTSFVVVFCLFVCFFFVLFCFLFLLLFLFCRGESVVLETTTR